LGKLKTWWLAHRPTNRRLVQLYCALLYNANLKGFAEGQIYTGPVKAACVPGLNCYSCPGAVGACPLGALQNAAASSGERAGTYILGILLLFGLMLGRTVCGWLCPMGWIQELLHKIPTPKIRKSRWTRALSYLKYVILAVFVLAVPLWYGLRNGLPLPAFCKYICPAGTLEGAMGLLSNPENDGLFMMLDLQFTWKFVIMLTAGLACVFCYRAFCRFLCPLGAVYSLFSRAALIGVRVDAGKCTRCGRCVSSCKMDVRSVGDHECIQCGDCMAVCGAGAISIQAGKITLKSPEIPKKKKDAPAGKKKTAAFAWSAALILLAFALAYFNFLAPGLTKAERAPTESVASDAPIGHEAGQQLADFTIQTLNGETFRLADTRGYVTIINRWATYCAPCVKELQFFDRLRQEHPEVTVLAVHAPLVVQDVSAYVEGHDWGNLLFCVDTEEGLISGAVGGTALLPQTVVLNARGKVVYNQTGSVTLEKLNALLDEAMASAEDP